MNQLIQNNWNKGFCPPLEYEHEEQEYHTLKKTESYESYEVESQFLTLFIGVAEAKWSRAKAQLEIKDPPEPFNAPLPPENIAAIQLLQSWRNEDAEEQRETWDFLRKALDEDRLSDRKFFP